MVFKHRDQKQTRKYENYSNFKRKQNTEFVKKKNIHRYPLFSKLGMLKLFDIHKLNASTFVYKYIKEKFH